MLTLQFDSRGLMEAFRRYVEVNRRDASELLQKQANALVNSLGTSGPKGLFLEALSEKAKVQEEINAAAARGPLKRRFPANGRSARQTWAAEYKRRMRFAAVIQASGWLTRRYGKASALTGIRRLYYIDNPPGQVRQYLEGNQPFIEITNRMPRAAEFANKTGYVQRAINNRERDMLEYVRRKTKERASSL